MEGGETFSILPELVSGRGTAPRSWVVEGQPRTRLRNDAAHDRVEIAEDLLRRYAQGRDAMREELGVPSCIHSWTLSSPMRFAIDLDREPRVAAVEVETECARRMLVPEFEPRRPLPQQPPQQHFGQAHGPSPTPRALHGAPATLRRMILEHRESPSTMLRMVPLPETSSGRN